MKGENVYCHFNKANFGNYSEMSSWVSQRPKTQPDQSQESPVGDGIKLRSWCGVECVHSLHMALRITLRKLV